MFESCQHGDGNGPARCADVAEKLAQLFGWRQTYKVEKLQRSLSAEGTYKKEQITRQPEYDPPIKAGDSWVVVHSLQSQDGGLLDPDDRLNDVADDREQIIANFEDGDGQHHHHGGGDGASGSSVGTGSPDIFQGESHKFQPFSRTDIEVTGEQIASGLLVAPLQVRRGSEPALNQLLPGNSNNAGSRVSSAAPGVSNGQHTWSAAPAITVEDEGPKEKRLYRKDGRPSRHTNGYLSADWYHDNKDEEEDKLNPPRFARDGSNRLSMQFLGEGTGFRWADAAERAAVIQVNNNNRTQSKSLPRDHRRKEPLGQANSTSPTQPHSHVVQDSDIEDELNSENVEYIAIHNEMGPLGIHVVPDYDRLGKDRGLLVQGIEPGGRIDRDGRLAVYDRIIEINGSNLLNMPFQRVQEIFKNSLRSSELRLRVIKHRSTLEHFKKPPPPVFPRSHKGDEKENVAMVEGEERLVSHKVATVSPTKKVSPGHPATRATNSLLAANTRKIGKKIELELLKGPNGLGFSITTRDNPAGGNCPIYIKNILTKGAAVEDGRLKPGDRLLEVNNVEMTGKTQSEAVAILRNAPSGSTVRIVVSRQEDSSSPKLPRPIGSEEATDGVSKVTPSPEKPGDRRSGEQPVENGETKTTQEPPDKVNDDGVPFPWKHREILTFDIPVHDTEKAGLGVSVKGKTTANHNVTNSTSSLASSASIDLGIFIKSVLHGGAASRDGRLRTNDQLLNVNGISLLNQSNSDAMETLRRAMLSTDGPIPGVISITVARRLSGPRESISNTLGSMGSGKDESYTPDNSGASENSDTTVIFLPYKTADLSRESVDSRDSTSSSKNVEDKYKVSSSDILGSRNPVISRLTGQLPTQNALRNESYYRATNEVWNTTMLLSGGKEVHSPTTVNLHGPEMVMIEEEYHQPTPTQTVKMDDTTYTSQLSLEEAAAGFSRDAFGRQSMSEKRHATLDAKHTDTYQRNKKVREERAKQIQQQQQHQKTAKYGRDHMVGPMLRANSIESIISMARSQAESENSDVRARNEFGPSLGMKKSSSLESLQTMVQEIQMQEDCDPAYTYRNAQGNVRVIRGRGCNESFRAAVDRSYEAPLGDVRSRVEMETLAEEDGPMGETGVMGSVPAFANVRGGPRQSSLNAGLDKNKHGKKKPGLLRGIGSMFRFGKHRKTLDTPLGFPGDGAAREAGEGGWDHSNVEREAARRAAQEEQQRIQEQYRRLMLRQRQMQQQNESNNPDGFPTPSHHREGSMSSSHAGPTTNGPSSMGPPAPLHKGHHRDSSNASSSLHIGSTHGQSVRDGPSSVQILHPHSQPHETSRSHPPNVNYGPSMTHINPSQRDGPLSSTHIGSVHINQSHNQKDGQNTSNSSQGNYRQRDNSNTSIQSGTYRDGPINRERDGSGSSASSQKGHGSNYREAFQQEGPVPPPHGSQSRSERIHQLRAQHQRRHAERRGQYPLEEREEKYEEVIRQRLEQPDFSQARQGQYDLYGEMSRPGSRVGISDPQRFSHYVNYEEIQLHLNKRKEQLSDSQIMQMRRQVQHQRFKVEEESRRQQHYHSQRRDNREPSHRPVSNFYEYESVQAFLRASQQQRAGNNLDANSNSLPRRIQERSAAPNSVQYQHASSNANYPKNVSSVQPRGTNVQDYTKNNLNKNNSPLPLVHNVQAFQGQNRNGSANDDKTNNAGRRTQGPFVTHVTIGQSQPPGSKV